MRPHAPNARTGGRARCQRATQPRFAHPCPRADEALRRPDRGRRHRLRRRAGRVVRVPRAQRRRQDLGDADDRLRLAAVGRHAARPRHGPGRGRAAHPRPTRRRAPAGHARHRADRPREPPDLRPLLRAVAGRVREARRRAARLRPADRTGRRPGRAHVGRHEAAPDDRPQPHQRAGPDAPGRADDRPRPAGAAPAVGPPLPAQAARRDARADDPLHGRGRAALRPPRRHGQGEDRRRGLAARAHRRSTPPAR